MGKTIKTYHTYKNGDKIGECIFIELVDIPNKHWRKYARFRCECGNEFITTITKVRTLHSKSCGCRATNKIVAFNTTHGQSGSRKTPEFSTWVNIIQRCHNPNNTRFHRYGGRGIIVCERWRISFENFFADMGKRPSKSHSIERVENDKEYSKGNCKWATPKEQAMNRRSNFLVTYNGEIKPLKMWTDELGLPYIKVRQRIKKLKWSVEEAFNTTKR